MQRGEMLFSKRPIYPIPFPYRAVVEASLATQSKQPKQVFQSFQVGMGSPQRYSSYGFRIK